MSKLRVLVVGASIAGPTAAYWLAKAGATVTVIERFPSLRTAGQNIDIRTAGVSVMRKMPGMEEAVRSKLYKLDGLSFVRDNGRPYGVIKSTGNPDQQSLLSEYEIFRGDLSQTIVDLTKDNQNIKYIFGEQIASMQQPSEDNGPVKIEFANGLPPSEYDLVVACDGSHSRTRAMALNCGVRDHIKPTNCWAAYFSIKDDLLQGSKLGKAHSAVGGRFISLGPDPTGRNRVTLMSLHPAENRDVTLPFREAMKAGDDALKNFVSKRYQGVAWKTEEILKGMMDTNDFYASEVVQVKPPRISAGRVALVGDAGYAPGFTGSGTTLALTGAYMLAGEICAHKNDLTAALQGYETRMRPIITEMQKVPPLVPTVMAPQTAWGLWLRNHIFAFISFIRIMDFFQTLFGAAALGSTEQYKLPEYEWVA